jgi:hypothetical protein
VSFVIDECHAGNRRRRFRNRNCRRDGVGPPGGGPGSYRIVDENGTVVAGDWANGDGGSGLVFATTGERIEGCARAWRLFAVKG